MKQKVCLKCEFEKELRMFSVKKQSKDGYKSSCKECDKEYRKKYYKKNKEEELNRNKKYNKNNWESIIQKQNEYYKINKEKIDKYKEEYRELNKEKSKKYIKQYLLDNPTYRSKYFKDKKQKDPLFKLICSTRAAISKSIKRNGYKKESKTCQILDSSFEGFKLYIESKFESWMNWENYGKYNGECNYGWDLDHIMPLSIATTEQDIIRLNHYTNFQPLCSHINRDIKKDNYIKTESEIIYTI